MHDISVPNGLESGRHSRTRLVDLSPASPLIETSFKDMLFVDTGDVTSTVSAPDDAGDAEPIERRQHEDTGSKPEADRRDDNGEWENDRESGPSEQPDQPSYWAEDSAPSPRDPHKPAASEVSSHGSAQSAVGNADPRQAATPQVPPPQAGDIKLSAAGPSMADQTDLQIAAPKTDAGAPSAPEAAVKPSAPEAAAKPSVPEGAIKPSAPEAAVKMSHTPSAGLEAATGEQQAMAVSGRSRPSGQIGKNDQDTLSSRFAELAKHGADLSLSIRHSATANALAQPTLSPATTASLIQAQGAPQQATGPETPSLAQTQTTSPNPTAAGLAENGMPEAATASEKGLVQPVNSATVQSPWPASGSLMTPSMSAFSAITPGSGWSTASLTSAAPLPTVASGSTNAPAVIEQVTVHIMKATAGTPTKIDIDLKPEHLGRVEVRLDFTQDGHIAARILAESPETLEILRAESATLERALTESGLKSDTADLRFDLKDQGRQAQSDSDPSDGGGNGDGERADDSSDDAHPMAWHGLEGTGEEGRIDIHA